jgi:hypothetical protein
LFARLQVRMNEGAMPPLVLAIAPPATARLMQQELADIKVWRWWCSWWWVGG